MSDSTKKRVLDVEDTSADNVQTKIPKIDNSSETKELESKELESKEAKGEAIADAKEEAKEEKKVLNDAELTTSTPEPSTAAIPKTTTKSFVFGSSTSFGNMGGFKMVGSKNSINVFSMSNDKINDNTTTQNLDGKDSKLIESASGSKGEDNDTKSKNAAATITTTATTKSIFGSGSTFGNAFQEAITKKSVFATKTESKENKEPKGTDGEDGDGDEKEKEKGEKEEESTSAKDVYKKVHLEKQDVKSGEENEDTIFQIKAKLYHMELSNISSGWKEKGFGVIKVNKLNKPENESKYNSRLIMRQNGNLKLILNLPIIKDFKVLKGMPSSLNGNKFIRLQILEDGEPVQYAIKIGQVENAEKLLETIQNQIPK